MENHSNLARMCECTRLYCTVVRNNKYMCELCAYPCLTLEDKKKLLSHPIPESIISEFGCSQPISFNTSEGIKTMMPGKSYDQNLNEIL